MPDCPGVAQMLRQNYFLMWIEEYSTYGTHVWYSEPGQIPVAGKVIGPNKEGTANVILPSQQDVNANLPCKHLFFLEPWIIAIISFGVRNFFKQWPGKTQQSNFWEQVAVESQL